MLVPCNGPEDPTLLLGGRGLPNSILASATPRGVMVALVVALVLVVVLSVRWKSRVEERDEDELPSTPAVWVAGPPWAGERSFPLTFAGERFGPLTPSVSLSRARGAVQELLWLCCGCVTKRQFGWGPPHSDAQVHRTTRNSRRETRVACHKHSASVTHQSLSSQHMLLLFNTPLSDTHRNKGQRHSHTYCVLAQRIAPFAHRDTYTEASKHSSLRATRHCHAK